MFSYIKMPAFLMDLLSSIVKSGRPKRQYAFSNKKKKNIEQKAFPL